HLLTRKKEGWPVGPSKTFLKQLAGYGNHGQRRFYSCNDCFASRYFLSITPTGFVVPCPLTFRSKPPLNGRQLGFATAFEILAQPQDAGGGCTPDTQPESLVRRRTDL